MNILHPTPAELTGEAFVILNPNLISTELRAYLYSITDSKELVEKLGGKILTPAFGLIPKGLRGELPSTSAYGLAFEHFIIAEIFRLADYHRKRWKFSYLRTKDDLEIDLIIETENRKKILIEIKSAARVDDIELNKYKEIAKDLKAAKFLVFSQEPYARQHGQFKIFPWAVGLEKLFDS